MLLHVVAKARPAVLVTALVALSPTGCKSASKRASTGAPASASAAPSLASSAKPQFIHWKRGELPLEQFVQREVERADTEHGRVMVYVGATWCEPCQHFHHAIERGELDKDLAGMRFLEFDVDQHGQQLTAAGYRSKYVPLFAIPDPAGRSSGRMLEGSFKGPNAVRENLLPRLRQLLADAAR